MSHFDKFITRGLVIRQLILTFLACFITNLIFPPLWTPWWFLRLALSYGVSLALMVLSFAAVIGGVRLVAFIRARRAV